MQETVVDIILIEDNPYEAELTIRGLQKNHLANKVQHFDDGVEALDFIFSRGQYHDRNKTIQPKLILLDLKLPKVDGLDILRALKNDDATRTIPVVVLTSSKEERDIVDSYNLGVNSYIVKPVNFESFTKAVAELGLYWMVLNQPMNITGKQEGH
jgi:two-component system, response regulator